MLFPADHSQSVKVRALVDDLVECFPESPCKQAPEQPFMGESASSSGTMLH
jgi:hypothetical protein